MRNCFNFFYRTMELANEEKNSKIYFSRQRNYFTLFLLFLVHCDPSLYRCDFTPFAETNTAIHRHPEIYGTQSNDLFF